MDSTPFPISTAALLFRRPRHHAGLIAAWKPLAQDARAAIALFCRDRLREGMLASWRPAAPPAAGPAPRR